MPALILVGVVLWFALGNPGRDVANWLWPRTPAPWETVDAYYYPDRNNLTRHEAARGLTSVDACRWWVRTVAVVRGDPGIVRGDYECGIGQTRTFMGLSVYRLTVR